MNNYLSACLIFRDSANYLEEWLLFHLASVVEHFYLYDNGSRDHWREVIDPFCRRGLVTVIPFPGTARQQEAYDHCLKSYGRESVWIAFIDDDEFLYPSDEGASDLKPLLENYESFAGLSVSWILYGSNGHRLASDEPVIGRFTKRLRHPDRTPKCVTRPALVERSLQIGHQFKPLPGYAIVDEKKRETGVEGVMLKNPSADVFRLNHYLIMSIEELILRRSRIDASQGVMKPISFREWLHWSGTWNDVEDVSAWRYFETMEMIADEFGIDGSRYRVSSRVYYFEI